MARGCLLVIDDDPRITDLLCIALGRGGYDIRASNRGDEALDLARSEQPDAVVLDLRMPGMSGQDVLMHLKTDRQLRNVPVIITTGDTDVPELHGVFATLRKPFKLKRLYRTINQALAG